MKKGGSVMPTVRQVIDEFLMACGGRTPTEKEVKFFEKLRKLGWERKTALACDVDATALISEEEYRELTQEYGEMPLQPKRLQLWE